MSTEKTEIMVDTSAAAQGDQQAATTEGTGTENLFAGEFQSVEDLAAAYAALKAEKAPTGEQTPAGSEGSEGGEGNRTESLEIPKEETPPAAGDAQAAVEGAGLDWDALNAEYRDKGALSEDTYAKLAKGGIPKDAVDTYIAGRQAQADAYDAAVIGTVGGVDDYKALVQWASTELSKADITAFNDAVTSMDASRAKMAVEALMGRRAAKLGTPPQNLLTGKKAPAGVKAFASRAEMTEAMRSQRYKNDPAYRAEVVERLRLSDF